MPSLFSDLLAGQSLLRAWMNRRLSCARAGGIVLDIGSGGSGNTQRMVLEAGARVLSTDIRPESRPSFVSDATAGLPLRDGAVDTVLLLNVLEHVYEHGRLLHEVGRVLKSGGVLYLYVPFLYPRHTARYPAGTVVEDHFRFGPEALRRLLAAAGFCGPLEVEACGAGPCAAGASLVLMALPWGWLRALVGAAGLALDKAYFLLRKEPAHATGSTCEWPLAYWVRALK